MRTPSTAPRRLTFILGLLMLTGCNIFGGESAARKAPPAPVLEYGGPEVSPLARGSQLVVEVRVRNPDGSVPSKYLFHWMVFGDDVQKGCRDSRAGTRANDPHARRGRRWQAVHLLRLR